MTHWAWKIAGTVAALFAGAAAVAVVDRALKKQQDKIDADLAAAPDGQPENGAEETAPDGQPEPSEGKLIEEKPAQQEQTEQSVPAAAPVSPLAPAPETAPNPNPVLAGPTAAPRTADGKVDPSRLCAPEDFSNWEDLGCQG